VPPKGFKIVTIGDATQQKIKKIADVLGVSIPKLIEMIVGFYEKSEDFQHDLALSIKKRQAEIEEMKALVRK
jgi:hypothetical protein